MKPRLMPKGFLALLGVELLVIVVACPGDDGTWLRFMLFIYGVYDCAVWLVIRDLERTGRGIKERTRWYGILLVSPIAIGIAFSVLGYEFARELQNQILIQRTFRAN
jgi:hypothetical protein